MFGYTLKRSKGLKDPRIQRGRGDSSGRGNTSGRGNKGEGQRAGAGMPAWFEGGQTPLVQRLPKMRGFKKPFKLVNKFVAINLSSLENHPEIKGEVTKELLIEAGLIKKGEKVKVLGNGELTKKISLTGMDAISQSAQEKIEKAGGTVK